MYCVKGESEKLWMDVNEGTSEDVHPRFAEFRGAQATLLMWVGAKPQNCRGFWHVPTGSGNPLRGHSPQVLVIYSINNA